MIFNPRQGLNLRPLEGRYLTTAPTPLNFYPSYVKDWRKTPRPTWDQDTTPVPFLLAPNWGWATTPEKWKGKQKNARTQRYCCVWYVLTYAAAHEWSHATRTHRHTHELTHAGHMGAKTGCTRLTLTELLLANVPLPRRLAKPALQGRIEKRAFWSCQEMDSGVNNGLRNRELTLRGAWRPKMTSTESERWSPSSR